MLTPAWTELRYHADQSAAWRTRAQYVALACGRGSGKTELARRRIIRYLPIRKSWPDPMYFFALPTREQAKRVAWDKLRALVPDSWVRPGGISQSDLIIRTIYGSSLHLVGMDKPQRIEGNQWDGCVVDESCDQQPGSFARSISPALTHRQAWAWRTGVPKRFGCGAADFKQCCEEWATLGPDYASFSWKSEGIVPDSELAKRRKDLDSHDYEEQFEAAWLSTSGLVFYSFDPVLNVRDVRYDARKMVIVGSDFNVDPMAWVVMQLGERDEFNVIDELWLRNTNTQRSLTELYNRYKEHKAGWLFIGDATARARNTRASESDYAQIRGDKRFDKARVLYPSANPPVHDRFAACNALLCNAEGTRRLFVSPRCTHLIHDLGTRAYKAGTREVDDYGDVGHITDAMGYPIHYMRPLVGAQTVGGQIFVGAA